jgi:hypothetical protein
MKNNLWKRNWKENDQCCFYDNRLSCCDDQCSRLSCCEICLEFLQCMSFSLQPPKDVVDLSGI